MKLGDNFQDEVERLSNNAKRYIPKSRNLKRGYQGEKQVKYILDTLDCEYMTSKIVWGRRNFKISEMDFIVYYKSNIILIEVKNWYGEILSFDSDKWTISTPGRNANKITRRTNPVHTIGRYRTDLHDYLARRGIRFRKRDIISIVVFTRDEFEITYDRNHSTTKLLKINELEGFLNSLSIGSTEDIIFEHINTLPTWDKVILKNGTYVDGKIKSNIISFCDGNGDVELNEVEYILFNDKQKSSFIKKKNGDTFNGIVNFDKFRIDVTPKIPLKNIKLILLNPNLYSISRLQDLEKI